VRPAGFALPVDEAVVETIGVVTTSLKSARASVRRITTTYRLRHGGDYSGVSELILLRMNPMQTALEGVVQGVLLITNISEGHKVTA
jgi:hypothetical protein